MYISECDIDLTKTAPRGYRENRRVGGFFHSLPFKSSLCQYCLTWQKWSKQHTDVIFWPMVNIHRLHLIGPNLSEHVKMGLYFTRLLPQGHDKVTSRSRQYELSFIDMVCFCFLCLLIDHLRLNDFPHLGHWWHISADLCTAMWQPNNFCALMYSNTPGRVLV